MAATLQLRRSLSNQRTWRPVLRAAAVAAAVYGLYVFVLAPILGRFSGEFEDFGAYLGAARASAGHTDIYAAFTQQAQSVALSGFDYPPIVAFLLTPLAHMSTQAAATLWLIVGVACTLGGALVVARTLLPAEWPRTELAVLATFVYAPATYNFWHGQMNPVVFLLLALALRDWVRGEQTRCGLFLGAAAAIKLAPLVLLLLMVRRGWWRGVAAAVGVCAAAAAAGVLAFGMSTTAEYVRSVLPVLGREDGWLYNQSWSGVVNRLADHSVLSFQADSLAIRGATLGLAAATLAAVVWAVRPGSERPTAWRGAEFGAGVAAMLLAGTLTWYAHDVHLLIPLAAAAGLLAAGARHRRALLVAAAAALAVVAVLAPWLISVGSMPAIVAASQGPLWWPLLQVASLPALGTAALLAALVAGLRGGKPALV